jgi:hypothetical protein
MCGRVGRREREGRESAGGALDRDLLVAHSTVTCWLVFSAICLCICSLLCLLLLLKLEGGAAARFQYDKKKIYHNTLYSIFKEMAAVFGFSKGREALQDPAP